MNVVLHSPLSTEASVAPSGLAVVGLAVGPSVGPAVGGAFVAAPESSPHSTIYFSVNLVHGSTVQYLNMIKLMTFNQKYRL